MICGFNCRDKHSRRHCIDLITRIGQRSGRCRCSTGSFRSLQMSVVKVGGVEESTVIHQYIVYLAEQLDFALKASNKVNNNNLAKMM